MQWHLRSIPTTTLCDVCKASAANSLSTGINPSIKVYVYLRLRDLEKEQNQVARILLFLASLVEFLVVWVMR